MNIRLVFVFGYFLLGIMFGSKLYGQDIELFSNDNDVDYARISPDGKHIASVVRVGDKDNRSSRVEILEIDTGRRSHYFEVDNFQIYINGLDWLNNDVIAVFTTVNEDPEDYSTWSRMVTVDIKKKELGTLFNKEKVRKMRHTGVVIDRLADDPEHVLIHSERIYKLNMYTKDRERIDVDDPDVPVPYGTRNGDAWFADHLGRPRVLRRVGIVRRHVALRDVEKNKTEYLWRFDRTSTDYVEPLGFDEKGLFYVAGYHNGRLAVKAVDPDSANKDISVVFSDPKYDVTTAEIKLGKSHIVGVRHPARLKDVYFDEHYKSLQDQLDKIFPDTYNQIVDASDDENRYVVYARSATNPGTYYLGDLKGNSLTPFAIARPRIDASKMGISRRIEFKAKDGTTIEALLTLPRNAELPVPLVANLMDRGISVAFFNPLNQALVKAGFGVVEIDHRGVSGYGYDFMRASQERWGLEMQQDLDDGINYLIENKIADANHLCLLGQVYGGYAAMMAIAQEPSKYRCAVSINGISDLAEHVRSIPNRSRQPLLKEEIGTKKKDMRERSPLTYADNIKTPLLLIYEEDYYGVDNSHSERMHEILQQNGVVTEKKSIKNILEPNNEAVTKQLYSAIMNFMQKHSTNPE